MSQTKVQLVSNIVGNVSGGASFTGIVTASNFLGNLTGTASNATTAGSASTATAAGTAYGLTGSPNITVGTVTGNLTGTASTATAAGTAYGLTGSPNITVGTIGASNVSLTGGLTVSGVTTVAAGSTSAPSVSPTGDNNTGIFFPSADTIAFAEGGAEVARFGSNGVFTIKNGAIAEIDTLTDQASITPDFATSCNFTVTLGGNRTIENPTNLVAGQSGSIFLVQDGSGSKTVSWGSYWDFASGTAPTLTTTANAVDRVDYIVRSSTSIHTVFTANYS